MQTKSIPKQVFISHEKNDKELKILSRALAKELQKLGLNVWTDEHLKPGSKWSQEIKRALKESDSMIALLNEHSFSSTYVRDELEHVFFDERYKNRLLPVFIESSSKEDFSRLPWVLKNMQFLRVDESKSTVEIARKIAVEFQNLINRWGNRS